MLPDGRRLAYAFHSDRSLSTLADASGYPGTYDRHGGQPRHATHCSPMSMSNMTHVETPERQATGISPGSLTEYQ
jgi:hypothetical protein